MAEEKAKELQPTASTGVTTRKKDGLKKAADSFIVEDAKTVGKEVYKKVVDPAVRKTLRDIVVTALDLFLYGLGGKSSEGTKTYSNPSYSSGKTQYNRVSQSEVSRPANRNFFEYDEILFESWDKADEVRLDLIDVINTCGVATVAELYEFAGLKTDNYMHNRYGWSDLSNASIRSTYDEGERRYVIKLPRPMPIDRYE